MGARGTLAEINWTDNKDVDGAVLGLAAFLVGASLNQFYGAIGWYWNCREIPVATLAPLVSKKLGEPLVGNFFLTHDVYSDFCCFCTWCDPVRVYPLQTVRICALGHLY